MNRLKFFGALALGAVGVAVIALSISLASAEGSRAESARIFELRTYTTNDGKLEELHARFRTHTNHLFVKHGMTLVGYWTPVEGDEAGKTLVYLLAHESREAAGKSWRAFGTDPVWREAYAASRANGPLVQEVESRFLEPTDYSPLR